MPSRSRPSRDFARRGAYIDHLNRWVWTVDSHGRKSQLWQLEIGEDPEAIATQMETALDIIDPIPRDAYVPPPMAVRSYLRLEP